MKEKKPKLFEGLNFYFYPPRSLSKLNGLKSKACAKRGAEIQNAPDPKTTHVIVGGDSLPQEFWNELKTNKLNDKCVIVSNEWPSECIDQDKLLDVASFEVSQKEETFTEEPQLKRKNEDSEVKNRKKLKNGEVNSSSQSSLESESQPNNESPSNASPSRASSHEPSDDSSRASSPLSPYDHTYQENPNDVLIEIFHDLMIAREAAGEEFSARAYKTAIDALEKAQTPIMNEQDALKVPKLTKKMAELVGQIRKGNFTNVLSQATRKKADIIQTFATVYGVGPYKARKLYTQGYRTLEDIKPHVDKNGQVSIEHHEDFVERISRKEVDKHYAKVQQLVQRIDPKFHTECMGSYRRGQLDCGDIDIILTGEGAEIKELGQCLDVLLKRMFDQGFAKYTFGRGPDRWLGATDVLSKWRRMDILLVPWKELGAAMIYYTGNDIFNRRLRLKAKRQGMTLSQNGLYKREPDGKKTLLEGHDERRILKLLDEPWTEPSERILS